MKPRKIASSIIRRLPVTGLYIRQKEQEIAELHNVVKRLEDRNDEWAAEVREMRGDGKPLTVLWPATEEDLVAADYRKIPPQLKLRKHNPPYTLNWIVPPVGSVSGGHAVIFRMIQSLESKGHACRVYFYDGLKKHSLKEIKENMKHHVPIKAELFYNEGSFAPCDAIFATGWTTAYPVYNYQGNAKKFYFLQDYEAMFEPAGTYNALADNTYKMGLHGVSTSPWVTDKVSREYGMVCDELSLGITPSEYYLTNIKKRKKIVFYARPVTPRRGFELGVLALQLFHQAHPEFEIHCIGWDISRYELPFPYVNRRILDTEDLNKLYNESATGLALSFTSMSLLPVEMMASGCIPVVNKAPYTTMVHYPKYVQYAEPSPQGLADAIWEAANPSDPAKQAQAVSDYAKEFAWFKYTDHLDRILKKELS